MKKLTLQFNIQTLSPEQKPAQTSMHLKNKTNVITSRTRTELGGFKYAFATSKDNSFTLSAIGEDHQIDELKQRLMNEFGESFEYSEEVVEDEV